jgi:hypothetical protein
MPVKEGQYEEAKGTSRGTIADNRNDWLVGTACMGCAKNPQFWS